MTDWLIGTAIEWAAEPALMPVLASGMVFLVALGAYLVHKGWIDKDNRFFALVGRIGRALRDHVPKRGRRTAQDRKITRKTTKPPNGRPEDPERGFEPEDFDGI